MVLVQVGRRSLRQVDEHVGGVELILLVAQLLLDEEHEESFLLGLLLLDTQAGATELHERRGSGRRCRCHCCRIVDAGIQVEARHAGQAHCVVIAGADVSVRRVVVVACSAIVT